jgi:hypothetical protein
MISSVDVSLFGEDTYTVDLKLLRPLNGIKYSKIKNGCYCVKSKKDSQDPAIEIFLQEEIINRS